MLASDGSAGTVATGGSLAAVDVVEVSSRWAHPASSATQAGTATSERSRRLIMESSEGYGSVSGRDQRVGMPTRVGGRSPRSGRGRRGAEARAHHDVVNRARNVSYAGRARCRARETRARLRPPARVKVAF